MSPDVANGIIEAIVAIFRASPAEAEVKIEEYLESKLPEGDKLTVLADILAAFTAREEVEVAETVADDNDIINAIVTIFRASPAEAEVKIEEYLESKLPEDNKLAVLADILTAFTASEEVEVAETVTEGDLFTTVLGAVGAKSYLPPDLANQKLIALMQTIVKSLGELVDGLNVSMAVDGATTKTIHEVLAASVESTTGDAELVDYLNQIKLAYASMYEGFKLAASSQIKKLLTELSPEKLDEGTQGKLNVGPFKKAQLYDIYCEKHRNLSSYVDRSIFMESLLHKFESESQQVFLKKRGRNG